MKNGVISQDALVVNARPLLEVCVCVCEKQSVIYAVMYSVIYAGAYVSGGQWSVYALRALTCSAPVQWMFFVLLSDFVFVHPLTPAQMFILYHRWNVMCLFYLQIYNSSHDPLQSFTLTMGTAGGFLNGEAFQSSVKHFSSLDFFLNIKAQFLENCLVPKCETKLGIDEFCNSSKGHWRLVKVTFLPQTWHKGCAVWF